MIRAVLVVAAVLAVQVARVVGAVCGADILKPDSKLNKTNLPNSSKPIRFKQMPRWLSDIDKNKEIQQHSTL